jgi:hypothetical protein
MSHPVIIARYFDNGKKIEVTEKDYEKMVKGKQKRKIAKMIYHRFYGRYIKPFSYSNPDYVKEYKNGFAMMANACLLIEALEAFYHGWEDTRNRSEDAFKRFFRRVKHFEPLKKEASSFYKHIRCGILHQAETTGGWKITRKSKMMFNREMLTINATIFSKTLEEYLEDFRKELESSEWDSEQWDNLRRKMRFVIKNCKQKDL